MNKSAVMIGAGFLLTFLLGALTGYLIGYTPNKPEIATVSNEQDRRSGNQRGERMRTWITNELGLEEHQREAFFELVTENRREMQRILRESQERVNAKLTTHADSLTKELEDILSDEQMEIYKERFSREAMLERQRQRQRQDSQRRQRDYERP
jgi:hypothetical protein